jgi:hypothetical protein
MCLRDFAGTALLSALKPMDIRTEFEKGGRWVATIPPDRTQRPFSSGS